MELTHNYKRQATFERLSTLIKQHLVRFINQNPTVFEALSRSGAPFGGSVLPVSQTTKSLKPFEATQEELVRIQQQLDALTRQVAQLTTQVNSSQSVAETRSVKRMQESSAPSKQIGIYRFWALQAQSHSLT